MFLREKRIGGRTYRYLVESVREGGKPKQRIVANLGCKETVLEKGDLDRLVRSIGRYASRSIVLSLLEGHAAPQPSARRIGAALLFERLWQETGCRAVLDGLLEDRQFAFPVERAVFLTVLHRLMVSGSDRSAEKWRGDPRIAGTETLTLHHLSRARAWLGQERPAGDQAGQTPFAPRCVKDRVEERLFDRRRDLFSDLSMAWPSWLPRPSPWRARAASLEGQGGETLGKRGYRTDHRPDLHQRVVGVIMDQTGRPVCCERWPGSTADVGTLIPVRDRLRRRFGIQRVCAVADRGMISEATIAALEERGLGSLLGVRERSGTEAREGVLKDAGPFVPLVVTGTSGKETDLEAKEVKVGRRR